MIEFVAEELMKIARILDAGHPGYWAEDMSNPHEGAGKIDLSVIKVLKGLKVSWDYTGSSFEKSNSTLVNMRQEWTRAKLPGTYDGKSFVLHLEKPTSDHNKYKITSPSGDSEVISDYRDIPDLFTEVFEQKKSLRSHVAKEINQLIRKESSNLFDKITSIIPYHLTSKKDFTISSYNSALKLTTIKVTCREENLKKDHSEDIQDSLPKIESFMTKMIEDNIQDAEPFKVKSTWNSVSGILSISVKVTTKLN